MKNRDNSKYLWISLRMTTHEDGVTVFDKYVQIPKVIDEKINNFLATDNGKYVVKNMHRFTLEDLVYKYNLKYLLKIHGNKQSIIDYVRNKIRNQKNNIVDYTNIPNGPGIIKHKLPVKLTKKEIQKIWDAKIDSKMQYVERMNAIEQHKIDRWEKENKPTFEQLKSDLFPRSIIEAYTDKLMEKREQIREQLAQKFPDPIYRPVYVRYYSTPEIIKEKLIGYVKDTHQIINDKPSSYTLKNVNKFLWNKLMEYKTRMKHMLGDDLICLKAMTVNNHVGCWILGCD